MSSFHPVTPIDSIKTNSARRFLINGHPILVANVDNEFYAIDDRCSHEDSSLSLGCLKGELISCTLHGSRFSVKTGLPMEPPATEAVRTYQTRFHDDMLEVLI